MVVRNNSKRMTTSWSNADESASDEDDKFISNYVAYGAKMLKESSDLQDEIIARTAYADI